MKSFCGSGRYRCFCMPLPSPRPNRPPEPMAIWLIAPCKPLSAISENGSSQTEKRSCTCEKAEIERGQDTRAGHPDRPEIPQAHAAGHQNDNTQTTDDHHGRSVRFQEQQHDIGDQQKAIRLDQALETADALGVARDPIGKANDNRNLGQLGRLKAEQPAPRAIIPGAVPGIATRISSTTDTARNGL